MPEQKLLEYHPERTKLFNIKKFAFRMGHHHALFPESCTISWCVQKVKNRARREDLSLERWKIELLIQAGINDVHKVLGT